MLSLARHVLKILILIVSLASASTQASVATSITNTLLCSGFGPFGKSRENKVNSGISEAQFNEVLDKIQKTYQGEFKARGAILKIDREWKSNLKNAYASRWLGSWWISMYGGLARAPGMTRDGFALVACHEIGHHIGGAPHALMALSSIASEGESDYFATLKCLRTLFADEDNQAAVTKLKVPRYVESECKEEFSKQSEQLICMRSSMAGWSVANVFVDMNEDALSISFERPDKRYPRFMSRISHPRSQCRLDTYFNGARCPAPVSQKLSDKSFWPGTCDRPGEQANTGSRPRCWFKPDGFTFAKTLSNLGSALTPAKK